MIGIGVNVATPEDALPVSPAGLRATSLHAEGADVARDELLGEMLRRLERWYVTFRSDPDPERTGLLAEYRALCDTLGRQVQRRTARATAPGGRSGRRRDPDGRLLVREADTHARLGRRGNPRAALAGVPSRAQGL